MRFSSIQAHWILAFMRRPLIVRIMMLGIQNHRWPSCPLKGLERETEIAVKCVDWDDT